jgi:hypothetical protein
LQALSQIDGDEKRWEHLKHAPGIYPAGVESQGPFKLTMAGAAAMVFNMSLPFLPFGIIVCSLITMLCCVQEWVMTLCPMWARC